MFWRMIRLPAGVVHPAAVEIAPHPRHASLEGVIEQVRLRGVSVEVDLLLSDGSSATTLIDIRDWNWLELDAGDVVPVRPLTAPAFSA
jgi:hypothetical protein